MDRVFLADQAPDVPQAIMVGLPTFGTISMYWHIQTHDMLRFGKPMNRTLIERVVKGREVGEARNLLVNEMLDWRGNHGERCSHLFFLDDDVLVQRHTLIRLMSWNKPIVSALYYAKSDTPQPLLFLEKRGGAMRDLPPDDRVDCYAHGMGCTLIRREVFEAVSPPWFKTEIGRFVGNDFQIHTEDTFFCEKAASAGFSPCVDTGEVVLHYDRTTDRCYGWLPQPDGALASVKQVSV